MVEKKKKTILVVDDAPDTVDVFKLILEKAGYNVLTANDGFACLKCLTKDTPDLILLDIMMPGMSGIDVFKKIILDKDLKKIPVAFLTAIELSKQEKSELKKMGLKDYISKPIAKDDLLAKVKALLK